MRPRSTLRPFRCSPPVRRPSIHIILAEKERRDTHGRVTGLENSSSPLTVPWITEAEIVTGCRSRSGATSDRSVVWSLRVLRCWLCQDTARALAHTPPGEARSPIFRVGALPGAQFVARSYF